MDFDASMYDDDHQAPNPSTSMAVDSPSTDPTRRDNALNLRGVDDMSTANVHTYISLFTTDSRPRIEWIDDTSLNLVYYTPEDAQTALAHLTSIPTDQVTELNAVEAHTNPEKPGSKLEVRWATSNDKKERGAKDRSRWYLFHPEDDPDTNPRRRHSPYSRPSRGRGRKSTDGADLFADRVAPLGAPAVAAVGTNGDLFAEKVRGKEVGKMSGEDLFTHRILEATSQAPARAAAKLPASDLFADKAGSRDTRTLAERIGGGTGKGDLFADRVSAGGPERTGAGLNIRGAGRRSKASDLF